MKRLVAMELGVILVSLVIVFWDQGLSLVGVNRQTVSYSLGSSDAYQARRDCWRQGGVYNQCGSPSCGAEPGTGCVAVCVPKCEFPGQYRWQVAGIFALASSLLIGLKAFSDFRKQPPKKPA